LFKVHLVLQGHPDHQEKKAQQDLKVIEVCPALMVNLKWDQEENQENLVDLDLQIQKVILEQREIEENEVHLVIEVLQVRQE